MLVKRFKTMAQVYAANRALGHLWFDPGTMRFWRSQIESGLCAGRYFISSEQPDDESPRWYTVREALEDGSIRSASEYGEFRSLAEARKYVRKLAKEGRQ